MQIKGNKRNIGFFLWNLKEFQDASLKFDLLFFFLLFLFFCDRWCRKGKYFWRHYSAREHNITCVKSKKQKEKVVWDNSLCIFNNFLKAKNIGGGGGGFKCLWVKIKQKSSKLLALTCSIKSVRQFKNILKDSVKKVHLHSIQFDPVTVKCWPWIFHARESDLKPSGSKFKERFTAGGGAQ